MSQQHTLEIKQANNSILGCISQTVNRSDPFTLLSTGEIHQVYHIWFQDPQYKRHTDLMEKVEWKATKVIKEVETLS